MRYDAATGTLIGTFVQPSAGGLADAEGIAVGPDGHLYVAEPSKARIARFDGATGAYLGTFAQVASGTLADVKFGAGGALFATNHALNCVERFNGVTGTDMGAFAVLDSGQGPDGLAIGPNGDLYVAALEGHCVWRFAGVTGASRGKFVAPGSGGLVQPTGIAFGPDGNLYVASRNTNSILRYNGLTGACMDAFVPSDTAGLAAPHFLAFGPNSEMWVCCHDTAQCLRFDALTGSVIGVVPPASGVVHVSGACYRRSAATLVVSSPSTRVGLTANLTARLTRSAGGAAVVGATLKFRVGAQAAGAAVTGADGVATVPYLVVPGAGAGDRLVTVEHTATAESSGVIATGTLTVAKGIPGFSQYSASGLVGQTVLLRTIMLAGGAPVLGRTVDFLVDGTKVGSGTSDATGASCSYMVPNTLAFGLHNLTASFAGDAAYTATSRTAAYLTVLQRVAFSQYACTGAPGQLVSLKSLVLSGGLPVIGLVVRFAVDGNPAGQVLTDATGATLPYRLPAAIAEGVHSVTVSFSGTSVYGEASRTSNVLTVVIPRANISFSTFASRGTRGQTLTLRTLVMAAGLPATGRTVQFAVDGSAVGSGVSDSSGASCAYTIPAAMAFGSHNVTVSVAADATTNAASRTTAVLTVAPTPTGAVYLTGFETGVGPEWSKTGTDVTPIGARRFLGQFGSESVTLTLGTLPAHRSVTVSWDVYAILSWDGNQVIGVSGATVGPDIWRAWLDGVLLVQTTFSNINHTGGIYPQAYPDAYPGGSSMPFTGASEARTLGYFWNQPGAFVGNMDAVYRLSYTVPHTSASLLLTFGAACTGAADESWGLDNVEVRVNP